MQKLTASVIGGGFGGGLSLDALAASDDFDLIAMTDLRPEVCRALELSEGAYLSSRHCCQVRFPVHEFVPSPSNDWQPGQPYSGVGGGRDGRTL